MYMCFAACSVNVYWCVRVNVYLLFVNFLFLHFFSVFFFTCLSLNMYVYLLNFSFSLSSSLFLPSSLLFSLFPLSQRDLDIPDLESYFEDEDTNRMDQFEFDMSTHKGLYYRNKFQFTDVSEGPINELAKCYIVGIQWILSYYYTGVPSWSW